MNFNLKVNRQGVITDYTYKTQKEARQALKELVVRPAAEYAATLKRPELVAIRPTTRSRKTIDVMQHSYSENSSSDYYFLMEKKDGKNELYISGVISKEGEKYDVDLVPQYEYGIDD